MTYSQTGSQRGGVTANSTQGPRGPEIKSWSGINSLQKHWQSTRRICAIFANVIWMNCVNIVVSSPLGHWGGGLMQRLTPCWTEQLAPRPCYLKNCGPVSLSNVTKCILHRCSAILSFVSGYSSTLRTRMQPGDRSLRAHLDQVPLNYPSETVVQPSSTAHFHYGFPRVEPLSRYSNKLPSSNLKTAIFQPCKRCHTP